MQLTDSYKETERRMYNYFKQHFSQVISKLEVTLESNC